MPRKASLSCWNFHSVSERPRERTTHTSIGHKEGKALPAQGGSLGRGLESGLVVSTSPGVFAGEC